MRYNDWGTGTEISQSVRVPRSGFTNNSYYETLSWGGCASGYAGIQHSAKGNNYIFSVWDNPAQRAPAKCVYSGNGT